MDPLHLNVFIVNKLLFKKFSIALNFILL